MILFAAAAGIHGGSMWRLGWGYGERGRGMGVAGEGMGVWGEGYVFSQCKRCKWDREIVFALGDVHIYGVFTMKGFTVESAPR